MPGPLRISKRAYCLYRLVLETVKHLMHVLRAKREQEPFAKDISLYPLEGRRNCSMECTYTGLGDHS